MSDDLVKRLRAGCVTGNYEGLELIEWAKSNATMNEAADRIEQLETIMRKLVEPFKASKPLFGAQHLRSFRVGDQVVEELLAAMEKKDER
jgi:hypothetical protein